MVYRNSPDYFEWYRRIKKYYPECLLLIKMGQFYETFGPDAEAMTKVCGFRLHQKNDGVVAAIPERLGPRSFDQLVAAGHRLVFAEETKAGFRFTGPPETWTGAEAAVNDKKVELPALPKRKKQKPEYLQRTLGIE
jgi:DNA mismatch repair ATPase MutS